MTQDYHASARLCSDGVDGDPCQRALVRLCASLLIAVLDGLAIQKALDFECVDLHDLFALWADIITESADRRLAKAASSTENGAAEAGAVAGEEGMPGEPLDV